MGGGEARRPPPVNWPVEREARGPRSARRMFWWRNAPCPTRGSVSARTSWRTEAHTLVVW
jgi:hypothetical protein